MVSILIVLAKASPKIRGSILESGRRAIVKGLGCRPAVEGMPAEPTKTVIAKVINLMPEVAKVGVIACLSGAVATVWLIAGRLAVAFVAVAAIKSAIVVVAAVT